MSDQTPTPDLEQVQDTSAVSDTITEPQNEQSNQTNWEDRYKEAQAWGTKSSQEAAQYRQLIEALQSDDPDTRSYAAQVLGLQLAQQQQHTDDEFEDDPLAEINQRINEIDQWRQQTMSQAQQQATEQRDVEVIGNGLGQLSEQLGRKLTDKEVQLLGDAAWANRDEQGLPNISQVIELFTGIRTEDQRSWAQGKRQAPFVSSSGQEATHAPDLSDDRQRQAWMAQQLADRDAAS